MCDTFLDYFQPNTSYLKWRQVKINCVLRTSSRQQGSKILDKEVSSR